MRFSQFHHFHSYHVFALNPSIHCVLSVLMIISCFIFKRIVFVLYTFVFVYRIAVYSDPLAGWPDARIVNRKVN